MLLHTETVRQVIDGEERAEFVRDLLLVEGPDPLAMVRRRLHTNGTRLRRGAVLLVHGFGQNRRSWNLSRRSFANYLAHVGFDVFAVDLRGHGRSRAFGSHRPSSLADHVRGDLPAAVREALLQSNERRLFLVGHSLGGLIAYAAAPDLEDRLRGIVTIGSPLHFGRGTRALRMLAIAGLQLMQRGGLRDKNLALPLGEIGRSLARRRFFWDSAWNPFPLRGWHPGSIEPEVLEEYLTGAFDRTSLSVMKLMLRWAVQRHFRSADAAIDYEERFREIDLPLLAIAGEYDRLAPPDSCRPAVDNSRSPDRSFVVVPFGHIDLLCGRRAPEEVWKVVRDWLVRH